MNPMKQVPGTFFPTMPTVGFIGLWSDGSIGPKSPAVAGAVRIAVDGANAVTVFPFYLLAPLTLTKFTFTIGTGSAGQTANFGIYDANGNKLIDTGSISCTTATTVTGTFTSIVLPPGQYYFAQACTNTTPTSASTVSLGTAAATILNTNKQRVYLKAANVLAAGLLPATLGALANGTQLSPALGWYE